MERHKLLGINVDSIGPEEVYKKVLDLSKMDRPASVILLDTYLLMRARFSLELRTIINSADLVLPISSGVKNGLKFLNKKLERVYNYYNFIITLLLNFSENSKYVYMIGGKKKNIVTASENLKASFPGIRLVGTFHGQYKKQFEDNLLTAVRKACPALVLVGFKQVKQEKWIYKRRGKFKSGVFIGVGNFINIIGGSGASPTEKSVQNSFSGVSNVLKNPFRFMRLFYYFNYIFMLIFSKIFKTY